MRSVHVINMHALQKPYKTAYFLHVSPQQFRCYWVNLLQAKRCLMPTDSTLKQWSVHTVSIKYTTQMCTFDILCTGSKK